MIRALLLLLTALPRLLPQADPATPCIVIEEGTGRWLYASVQVYDLSTLEVIVWLNSGLHDGTFHIRLVSRICGQAAVPEACQVHDTKQVL